MDGFILLWFLAISLHLPACIALTWKAKRWSGKHPLGADSDEALLGTALVAFLTSGVVLLVGLTRLVDPLKHALGQYRFQEAALYASGLGITFLAALPVLGIFGSCRKKANLMTLLGGLAIFTTCFVCSAGIYLMAKIG